MMVLAENWSDAAVAIVSLIVMGAVLIALFKWG